MFIRIFKNQINQAEKIKTSELHSSLFFFKDIPDMRPTNKSRNRNRNNRRITSGNIINRVFESAGPEGKVRGTPQQVIEKYSVLAHDAQLSGDRVAAENFMQHSEHYSRILSEAQKENDLKAEADLANSNGGNISSKGRELENVNKSQNVPKEEISNGNAKNGLPELQSDLVSSNSSELSKVVDS